MKYAHTRELKQRYVDSANTSKKWLLFSTDRPREQRVLLRNKPNCKVPDCANIPYGFSWRRLRE